MNQEIKEVTSSVVVEQPSGAIVQTTEKSKGLINDLLKKFTENKMYMYIAIGIVILAVVAFYYFKKCKKDVKSGNKNQLPIPKQNESSKTALNNDDHFILDSNGNPVKVTGSLSNQLLPLPIPKQQPSQHDVQMLHKQMYEKQMQQQMMQEQSSGGQKPKLQHPESEMSEDIDVDLDDIQDEEDENVAQHNLTNSELAEINKKIEMMNSQK
jgi:hypothetical protein